MSIICLSWDIDGQMLMGLFIDGYLQKPDWVSEIVTTREAIASKKYTFFWYVMIYGVNFDFFSSFYM